MEVCFPVRIGDMFDFPYREIWATIEEMVDRIGADHLMWGTDLPFQNRHCTYIQSRVLMEKYCTFLDADQLGMIMGGTVARVPGPPGRGRLNTEQLARLRLSPLRLQVSSAMTDISLGARYRSRIRFTVHKL